MIGSIGTLALLLLVPLSIPLIMKMFFQKSLNILEIVINIVIVILIVSGSYYISITSQTDDTEIWNGKIISKDRVHGEYTRSYECNCYETCSGSGKNRSCSTTCSTCYEDRYTVHWKADANYGFVNEEITFKHLDRGSRRVYNEPDPQSYTDCIVGEPASKEETYTNYVKAVPDSIINPSTLLNSFEGLIPSYPRVRSKYKINRVLNVNSGISKPDRDRLNMLLNVSLIELAPKKQVNFIVIVTNISDPSYRYAVESEWIGAKKNDAVIFLGIDGEKIIWADVMTFAGNMGNEVYNVTLRDALLNVQKFDPDVLAIVMEANTDLLFDRISMKEFEYLGSQVTPSTTAIVIMSIVGIICSLLLSIIFTRVDIGNLDGYNLRKFKNRR